MEGIHLVPGFGFSGSGSSRSARVARQRRGPAGRMLVVRERRAYEGPDGGGVVHFHLRDGAQRRGATREWSRGQGEHLEAGSVVGDEILVDQCVAHVEVLLKGEFQDRAE